MLCAALLMQLSVAGCSTPQRLAAVPTASTARAETGLGPIRYFIRRDTTAYVAEAQSALDKEIAYRASIGETGPLPPVTYLAVSGGGENGAYGAGLLTGWSALGTRPEFKLVTGVSTGALIAPFAFLGPKYDKQLEEVYTQISGKDIFKMRGMIKGFFSDAMADSKPLLDLVTRKVDRAMLDAIAAEYAKGRLLMIGTANMDSLEPVIWNMTAIAASKDPRAPELFHRLMVASASIPGAFPPMMIDVTVDGVHYQEMHADGGTIAQVFLDPPLLRVNQIGAAQGRKRTLYMIRNARLDADWANVDRRTLPLAARAISSLTQMQGIGDLYRIFTTTQRDGVDYNLAFVPSSFNEPHPAESDTEFMRSQPGVGRQRWRSTASRQKYLPGYVPD